MSTVRTGSHPDGEPARRGRGRLVATAVTAAVLLAGGGALWIAPGGNPGPGDGELPIALSDSPGPPPPPLLLDGYGSSEAAGQGSARAEEYRASGELPDGPAEAPVGTPGPVDEETVTALARALGIAAQPEKSGDRWRAADGNDGSGPTLTVNLADGNSWMFTRYVRPDDGKRPGTGPAQPITPPVSAEEAREIAAPVLEAAGLADAEVDAARTAGALREVEAAPQVAGLPTHGWRTSVTVGADGQLVRADGYLGQPREGTMYPVLSAEETLRELTARRGQGVVACFQTPCDPPAAVRDGERRVTGAAFGLSAFPSGGEALLVPSWLFEMDGGEGGTVAFPAVEPRFITPGAAAPGVAPSSGADVPLVPPFPVEPPGDEPTAAPLPTNPPQKDGTGPQPGTMPPADPDDPAGPPNLGVEVDAYSATDKELTLHFTGGVCSDYRATTQPVGDKLRVTLAEHVREPGRPCIMIAKEMTTRVFLDRPLGDRTVTDAEGDPIPQR